MERTQVVTTMSPVQFLAGVLGVLVSLSAASERLVEVVKNLIPFLRHENKDEKKEGWRLSILQILAVGAGIVTALLARPFLKNALPGGWDSVLTIIALGFLASGGSGLWKGLLSWVSAIQKLKREQFVQLRERRTGSPQSA